MRDLKHMLVHENPIFPLWKKESGLFPVLHWLIKGYPHPASHRGFDCDWPFNIDRLKEPLCWILGHRSYRFHKETPLCLRCEKTLNVEI